MRRVRGWPWWTLLFPFQVDVPLVAERVGEVVQPCLDKGHCPIPVEAQHRCHHVQAR